MYEYIKGSLVYIGLGYIVIENNDIGYKIYTSDASVAQLKGKDEKVMLYTQLIHREDDMSIFGFFTKEELKMFQLLMTVSGVGAKVALGILSSIAFGELIGAIISNDIKTLMKAQGVGKKTAQRIALELKDKVDEKLAIIQPTFDNLIKPLENEMDEAISALMSLGYKKSEAEQAVNKVADSNSTLEDVIKKSLKLLSK